MAPQIARGNVRSVKIFDSSKKGEIILRTGVNTNVEIKKKIKEEKDRERREINEKINDEKEIGE